MTEVQKTLRERTRSLFEDGTITCLIGWEAGRFDNTTTPVFIRDASQAERLVYNDYCVNILSKYPLSETETEAKIGVCVRGCDSRGINLMLKDGQIEREKLYLIGIPCDGMKQADTGEALKKCAECTHRNPVVYDELLGTMVEEQEQPDRFAEIERIESLSADERYDYWVDVFSKCIRCKACRDVCPCCTCKECFTDQTAVGWQGKETTLAENQNYGITRMFHAGERCIECGECERICPQNLPLMHINRKVIKDAQDIFGSYTAGIDDCTPSPLDQYSLDDLEEFM